MQYTVRVFTDSDQLTYTDTEYATVNEAYGHLYQEEPPLSLDPETPPTPVIEFPFGFAIAKDGIVIHSTYADLCDKAL
jgi:hypothetical protein